MEAPRLLPLPLSSRYNKLGLDKILAQEAPAEMDQVEEAFLFCCVRSAPLSTEAIVWADIGTAHSAVVTGVFGAWGCRGGGDWPGGPFCGLGLRVLEGLTGLTQVKSKQDLLQGLKTVK